MASGENPIPGFGPSRDKPRDLELPGRGKCPGGGGGGAGPFLGVPYPHPNGPSPLKAKKFP